MARISVTKSQEKPETTEILAKAIVRIGEGFEALSNSGINQRGIVVLLKDCTKLPAIDIECILKALKQLKSWYCK